MSDWNARKNGAQLTLSSTYAYEGNKALMIISLTTDYAVLVLTQTETDTPSAVNVEFWRYGRGSGVAGAYPNMAFFFRYQDLDNYNVVKIKQYEDTKTQFYFGKRKATVYTEGTKYEITEADDTWYHYKIKICDIGASTYFVLYEESGGQWVLKTEDSMAIEWATGAFGIGFEHDSNATSNSDYANWVDLTKIYY